MRHLRNGTGFTILLALLLGGCGGGDMVAPAGGPGGENAIAEECGVEGTTTLVPVQKYLGKYDEAEPIARLQVAGDQVFFAIHDELYAVPLHGGARKLVYTAAVDIGVFWVLGDEILVPNDSADSLDVVPRTGGAASKLVFPAGFFRNPDAIILSPDQQTFYFRTGAYVNSFAYWRFDWRSGEARELLPAGELGDSQPIVLQSGYLYFTDRRGDELLSRALYRIPVTGGSAEAVLVEGGYEMSLAGSDAESLYFAGATDTSNSAFYRVSRNGGVAEQIVEPSSLYYVSVSSDETVFTNLAGRAVVGFDEQVYEFPASGRGSTLLSMRCGISTYAITDTDVVAATDDGNFNVSVIRIPLP